MRTFGIVVDSLINLNFKERIFQDASIVSLSFMMNEKLYIENNKEKYRKINKKDQLKPIPVKTESFIEVFKEQKALGYETVIYLASSTYFIDTINQANLAKTILNDPNIYIIDTQSFGPGIEYLLEIINFNKDKKIKDLIQIIYESIEKVNILFLKEKVINLGVAKIKLPLYEAVLFKGEFFKYKTIFKSKTLHFMNEYINRNIKIGDKPYIKVFAANKMEDAKILQHEIHTFNKDVEISNYGVVPLVVAYYLKEGSVGILYGNYGE